MTELDSADALDATRTREGHRQLLLALLEAVTSETGGEVVIRSGRESGRIHITRGQIAWVNVSTVRETFGEHLTSHGLVAAPDLKAVFEECRRTGGNFAELAISWGLVSAETMRTEFFRHTISCMAATFRLPAVQSIFAPINRTYRGTLLFTLEEIIDGLATVDDSLSPFLSKRWPNERIQDYVDRIELESISTEPEAPQLAPLDVESLRGMKGILAASVTDGLGRGGFFGSFAGSTAEAVTPRLDLIRAVANHATARSGLGNVVGLWINAPEGVALIQEFSEGAGLVRCFFAPGTNPALVRIQLEKILSKQDTGR